MNTDPNTYFTEGCGRCSLYQTPECKVHRWEQELLEFRRIILDTGLTEESKWGAPCYSRDGKNICMIGAFKDYCCISFFKGALLKDEEGLLTSPGPNSQSAKLFRTTDVSEVLENEAAIKAYVFEAIEVEKAELKVQFKDISQHEIPEELEERFANDPNFRSAFEALTPGRQRGYLIHISGAKQSKTRKARIDKCMPVIFEGKGMHDR